VRSQRSAIQRPSASRSTRTRGARRPILPTVTARAGQFDAAAASSSSSTAASRLVRRVARRDRVAWPRAAPPWWRPGR
jgi:hypothetical protein